jgi:hypothetical protein
MKKRSLGALFRFANDFITEMPRTEKDVSRLDSCSGVGALLSFVGTFSGAAASSL